MATSQGRSKSILPLPSWTILMTVLTVGYHVLSVESHPHHPHHAKNTNGDKLHKSISGGVIPVSESTPVVGSIETNLLKDAHKSSGDVKIVAIDRSAAADEDMESSRNRRWNGCGYKGIISCGGRK